MKRTQDETDSYPAGTSSRVPIHCSYCGTLLGMFSPDSRADLELRCSKCKNDYSVTLREEVTALEHKRSKKQPPDTLRT